MLLSHPPVSAGQLLATYAGAMFLIIVISESAAYTKPLLLVNTLCTSGTTYSLLPSRALVGVIKLFNVPWKQGEGSQLNMADNRPSPGPVN